MNIDLTPELEKMVYGKVHRGLYNNASEVVQEALRRMVERDRLIAIKEEEFRKKIAAGLKSLDKGRFSDGEEFFAQIEAELDEEITEEDARASRQQNEH